MLPCCAANCKGVSSKDSAGLYDEARLRGSLIFVNLYVQNICILLNNENSQYEH